MLAPYCGEYTKNLLDTGVTYARARQKAVEELYGPEVAEVLSSPNNTLAVEYLKQISLQELRIAPFTIPRAGAAHDAREPGEQFASASHLRNLLDLESAEALAPYVPAAAMSVYRSAAARRADALRPAQPQHGGALHPAADGEERLLRPARRVGRGARQPPIRRGARRPSPSTSCSPSSKPSAIPSPASAGSCGTPTSAWTPTS